MRRFASSWSGTLSKLGFRRKRNRCKNRHGVYHRRPSIESLEPRQLLSITVNTLVDENNGYSVGSSSLREALAHAAALPGDDTLNFDPSLTGGTIKLNSALYVDSNVAIIGLGIDKLTINAQGVSRVIEVAGGKNVSLSGLTLKGGGQVDIGAGVLNFGNLTLDRVHVTENSTSRTTPYTDSGGGIYSLYGSLHITNSTFDFNKARWNAGIGFYANETTDVFEISGSTISNNTARDLEGYGGIAGLGIYSHVVNATFKMTNSTVSGNSAPSYAGVFVAWNAGLTIVNSTITENAAMSTTGGIYASDSNSQVTLYNTIVAGNHDNSSNGTHRDLGRNSGSFNSASSNNLIGVVGGSGLTSPNGIVGNESVPKDPGLTPLGDYGGPTKTHALLHTSEAVDAGLYAKATEFDILSDQRGYHRFIDQNNIASNTIDIGAYELGLIVSTSDDVVDGNHSYGHLSLREASLWLNKDPTKIKLNSTPRC